MYVALTFLSLSIPAHAENPTLLVLGDSLSAAYGIPAEQGWVNLLARRLEEQNSETTVVNASVSGATTSAGLALLPSLLKVHQPKWVMLELGANDGLQGKPIPFIEQQLRDLLEQIHAAGAKPIIFGMSLPPNYGDRYTKPFSAVFPKLARDYDAVYVPFLLEGVAGNADLMQADGLHPKTKAQPLIFEHVWAFTSALLTLQTGSERLP